MTNDQHDSLESIRCTLMRGGTSKGPFFLAGDLPTNIKKQEETLLRILGAMTANRIDGVGGLDSLSNKIAIISKSTSANADVDYLFLQAKMSECSIDRSVNCGNIMSGVAPFAIERGLVPAQDLETIVRIRNLNTNALVHATVQTPDKKVSYAGQTSIDGVPGTAAPILLDFRNIVGSKTGRLLPTGSVVDIIDDVRVTCIDVAVPMVLIPASDLGLQGNEMPAELAKRTVLLERIEKIRRLGAEKMGLGDVTNSVMPKLALLSRPKHGGTIQSRYFTPKEAHTSHAVTGALCVGAACMIPGSVAGLHSSKITDSIIKIEHPSGTLDVSLVALWSRGKLDISRAALVRTARKLFDGEVYLPVSPIPSHLKH